MPFAAALSTLADSLPALEAVCNQTLPTLQGPPDLALLFYARPHLHHIDQLALAAWDQLRPRCLLGCPGESIIANDQEIEDGPALALWLARWTQPVELTPFELYLEHTPDGASLLGWPDELAGADPNHATVLTVADPYTFPVDLFLSRLQEESPGLRLVGGMASGINGPGQCRMLFGKKQVTQGAVGVLLQGNARLRSVVSQGCRPIGRHMVITRAKDNVIQELSGLTPLAQLQQLWQELGPDDQFLASQGLHIGLVVNEYRGDFQRGNFLVRNVMGVDRSSGALVLTDRVRVGQTVQFQVRDAHTADEDLHELLRRDLQAHPNKPAAALVFSCNGRGTRLFPQPHHDASTVRAEAGPIPLAGFFAQGELGPISGQNFIHGYTASVALFEE